ncbi:hypothetical protein FRB96_006883 [Tulasnella sp. 330]|nr:hypothetical protein FRB96_006883 [Tulasnella sp. 330]
MVECRYGSHGRAGENLSGEGMCKFAARKSDEESSSKKRSMEMEVNNLHYVPPVAPSGSLRIFGDMSSKQENIQNLKATIRKEPSRRPTHTSRVVCDDGEGEGDNDDESDGDDIDEDGLD